MQYMLIYGEPEAEFDKRDNPEFAESYWGAWTAYMGAMSKAGIIVNGDALRPPHTATTVRMREGKRAVQDGPYANVKEQLGGYVIIDVADLDAAIDWAAQAPAAHYGAVEVRPVLPMNEAA